METKKKKIKIKPRSLNFLILPVQTSKSYKINVLCNRFYIEIHVNAKVEEIEPTKKTKTFKIQFTPHENATAVMYAYRF